MSFSVARRSRRLLCHTERHALRHAATAAIRLAKLSRSLPAALVADVLPNLDDEFMHLIVTVEADAVNRFAADATNTLLLASEATIPLASGRAARFVVFRDAIGVDQVAIIVGKPDITQPMPVRLHSACLTGDVFGSRRCDCGDQLRLALARLESLGGGVIPYMAQEGRGIGLANKMRAYRLLIAHLNRLAREILQLVLPIRSSLSRQKP
jgi:GTP cyclohydrolase II